VITVPDRYGQTDGQTDGRTDDLLSHHRALRYHRAVKMEKMERRPIQGLSKFLKVPPIISGTGEAADFKLCRHIYRIDRNRSL